MPPVRVQLSAISKDPERDGVWLLRAHTFGATEVDVVLSEAEAVQLVRTLQEGFVERIGKRAIHPNYPTVTVVGADLAHGENGSALLLQTAEMGSMVAMFDPHLAGRLKTEIDRVVETNTARKRPV